MFVHRPAVLSALALPLLALAACGPTAPTTAPTTPAAAIEPSTRASAVGASSVTTPAATPGTNAASAAGGSATGSYAAALPAADGGARLLTLALAADGTATLTTGVMGKSTVQESGQWTQTGDQVAVALTATGGTATGVATLFEFQVEGGNLVNKAWNKDLYGDAGLGTLLKQP
jgi:hypothetical protein